MLRISMKSGWFSQHRPANPDGRFTVAYTPPRGTMDARQVACSEHHPACHRREAEDHAWMTKQPTLGLMVTVSRQSPCEGTPKVPG